MCGQAIYKIGYSFKSTRPKWDRYGSMVEKTTSSSTKCVFFQKTHCVLRYKVELLSVLFHEFEIKTLI